MTRRMTPWTPTTRLLTTLLALATTTAVVFRARAMTTMMIMTVIDVFALLPDLIECKYPRPPIADACALVVNTLIFGIGNDDGGCLSSESDNDDDDDDDCD